MKITTVTAVFVREHLGEILNRVRYAGERFVIARRGEPMAAIVTVEDLRRLEALEDARASFSEKKGGEKND